MIYTIGDAVKCGEWSHYTDTSTGNLAWENMHTKTWYGHAFRIWRAVDFWTMPYRRLAFKHGWRK